ncbi:MAG TPA: TonB family protein [Bryobacteraceae bacterium]|nr:TonB family protein [Bryobacteraceae bacterium]
MTIDPTLDFGSSSNCYVWQVPGIQISICLSIKLIEKLRQAELDSPAKREREITGVLLGSSTTEPTRAVVIEDYESIPDGTPGKTGDQEKIYEIACKWPRASSSKKHAVGFFRVQKAGWLNLDERDLAIARRSFSHPEDVVLLIRSAGNPKAAFFGWEDGVLRGARSYHEFPFDAQLLGSAREVGGSTPRPVPIEPVATPLAPWTSRLNKKWIAGIVTVVILAGAMIALSNRLNLKTAFPGANLDAKSDGRDVADAPLGLKVVFAGGQLNVNWNHESGLISGAGKGVMWITDGGMTKLIELDSKQLHDGSIAYIPLGEDVNIRLEVSEAAGHSVAESVRVLARSPLSGQAAGQPAITSSQPWLNGIEDPGKHVLESKVANGRTELGVSSADFARGHSVTDGQPEKASLSGAERPPSPTAVDHPSAPKTTETRPFVPPQVRQTAPRAGTVLGEAPPVVSGTPSVQPNPVIMQSQLHAIAPPPQTVVPAPTRAPALSAVSSPAPRLEAPAADEPVQAQIVRRVVPVMPQSFARTDVTSVKVSVQVDAQGNVANAEVEQASKLAPEARQAILAAVGQWKFRPAKLHGKNVSSSAQVEFQFRPRH